MILSKADLTTPNLLLLGEMLMEKSDGLSDWLWEECGGDPDFIIPNATISISISIDHEKRMNFYKLGVIDRRHNTAPPELAARGQWAWLIPVDEHVGNRGQCSLAEVVDFLGGETYDMILRNPIMLRKMAVDMLKRYETEGSV